MNKMKYLIFACLLFSVSLFAHDIPADKSVESDKKPLPVEHLKPKPSANGSFLATGGNCTDTLDLGVQSSNSLCDGTAALDDLWLNPSIVLPPGGTWTFPDGSAVPNGTIDETSPSGIYSYYYVDAEGCTVEISMVLNISPEGSEFFPANAIEVCLADPPFAPYDSLLGTPASLGGSWIYYSDADAFLLFSGNSGAINWTLDPADYSAGNPMVDGYLVYYSNDPVCGFSQDTIYIDVFEVFDAGQFTSTTICEGVGLVDLEVLLLGSPTPGGSWEDVNGTPVANPFDPAAVVPDSTYTLTYSGGFGGTSCFNSQVLELTVSADSDAPAITCPEDIQISVDNDNCTASASYTLPTASDACSTVELDLEEGLPSGADFPLGTNSITYGATDTNGNSATCSFTIEVVDFDPPEISCQDIAIELDENGEAVISIDDIGGSTTDFCGVMEESLRPSVLTEADLGVNQVSYTSVDNNGNEATCIANVEVSLGVLSGSNATGLAPVFMRIAPNPTDARSTIAFRLVQTSQVLLEVYDMEGRLLEKVYEGEAQGALDFTHDVDLNEYSAGTYICRLTSDDWTVRKKLILTK